jgi:hypothetical protein
MELAVPLAKRQTGGLAHLFKGRRPLIQGWVDIGLANQDQLESILLEQQTERLP